jgi:hypothetical protein
MHLDLYSELVDLFGEKNERGGLLWAPFTSHQQKAIAPFSDAVHAHAEANEMGFIVSFLRRYLHAIRKVGDDATVGVIVQAVLGNAQANSQHVADRSMLLRRLMHADGRNRIMECIVGEERLAAAEEMATLKKELDARKAENEHILDRFDADILPSIRRMCCVMRYHRSQTQSGLKGVGAFHQLLPGHSKEHLEIEASECETWCKTALAECGDDIDAVGRFATELSASLMDMSAYHVFADSIYCNTGPFRGVHLAVLHIVIDQSMCRATGGEELVRFEIKRNHEGVANGMTIMYCGDAVDPDDEAMRNALSKYLSHVLRDAVMRNGVLTYNNGENVLRCPLLALQQQQRCRAKRGQEERPWQIGGEQHHARGAGRGQATAGQDGHVRADGGEGGE